MRRPTQQVLFKQAENALKKDPTTLTASEKVAIYKALNLSLTNHNAQEVAAQSRFYAELSKKGYNALLDYNDKDYNQLIYLIETRCSGAMTTPYGAMAIEMDAANSSKA